MPEKNLSFFAVLKISTGCYQVLKILLLKTSRSLFHKIYSFGFLLKKTKKAWEQNHF